MNKWQPRPQYQICKDEAPKGKPLIIRLQPKQPFYSERELAGLLDVDRTSLNRWRKRGGISSLSFISLNDKVHSVWYPESAVRDYLSWRFTPYPEEMQDGQTKDMAIDGILACMSSGHSPFRAYVRGQGCPRIHWLSLRKRRNWERYRTS